MSFDCYGSVALPQGTVGWSAVCNCDISSSYLLTFSCDFVQSKFKSPRCKNPQQGSAVSYQSKCFTKVILLFNLVQTQSITYAMRLSRIM